MAAVLGDLYLALRSAGASHEIAAEAARESAGGRDCFDKVRGDLRLIKWMGASTLVMTGAILTKLLI